MIIIKYTMMIRARIRDQDDTTVTLMPYTMYGEIHGHTDHDDTIERLEDLLTPSIQTDLDATHPIFHTPHDTIEWSIKVMDSLVTIPAKLSAYIDMHAHINTPAPWSDTPDGHSLIEEIQTQLDTLYILQQFNHMVRSIHLMPFLDGTRIIRDHIHADLHPIHAYNRAHKEAWDTGHTMGHLHHTPNKPRMYTMSSDIQMEPFSSIRFGLTGNMKAICSLIVTIDTHTHGVAYDTLTGRQRIHTILSRILSKHRSQHAIMEWNRQVQRDGTIDAIQDAALRIQSMIDAWFQQADNAAP